MFRPKTHLWEHVPRLQHEVMSLFSGKRESTPNKITKERMMSIWWTCFKDGWVLLSVPWVTDSTQLHPLHVHAFLSAQVRLQNTAVDLPRLAYLYENMHFSNIFHIRKKGVTRVSVVQGAEIRPGRLETLPAIQAWQDMLTISWSWSPFKCEDIDNVGLWIEVYCWTDNDTSQTW